MSVRLGLYDFFAYTIPGGLYIFLIAHLAMILGWITLDFQLLSSLSAVQIFILAALAYIAGLIIEPVAKQWRRLFKSKGLAKIAYEEFKQRYSHLEIGFRPEEWGVLLAYVRRESTEVAAEVERLNVTSIMLGNISLGLASLAALQMVEFVRTGFFAVHFVMFVALAVLSILAGRECTKFSRWFYLSIFDAIAARSLKISDLVPPKQSVTPVDDSSKS